jgi:flagellar hook-basal body complex protein FliE
MSPPSAAPARSSAFGDVFLRAMGDANRSQASVEHLIERVAAGEDVNPATLAAAVNKADLAMRTMIQIRNKLTQAFDELRQMQV